MTLARPAALATLALLLALACLPPARPAGAQAGPPAFEHIGHLGGAVRAVAARPPYAYAGVGHSLEVLDISAPARPRRVGLLPLPRPVAAIALSGDYAYLVGAGSSIADAPQALLVVDISAPAAPRLVASLSLPGRPTGGPIALAGRFAYVGGAQIVVVDLADPAAPREAARFGSFGPEQPADLALSGGHLYVAAGSLGLRVFSLANPLAGAEVASFDPPGEEFMYALATEGERLYSYSSNDATAGVLRVFSIVERNRPERLGSLTGLGYADEIAVSGRTLYVAAQPAGETLLRLVDVSVDSAPAARGQLALPAPAPALAALPGLLLAANTDALRLLDVADASAPALAGEYASLSYPMVIAVDGARAVSGMLGEIGRLTAVDIADPQRPRLPGRPSAVPTRPFALRGEQLYVAEGAAGVGVYRVLASGAIEAAGRLATEGDAVDLAHAGDLLYVVEAAGLLVADLGDPLRPAALTRVALTGLSPNAQIAVGEGRAYVAPGCAEPASQAAVRVLDLSDPRAPRPAGSLTLFCDTRIAASPDGATLYAIEIRGCVGSTCLAELRIFTTQNADQPRELGALDLAPAYPTDIVAADEYVLIASGYTPRFSFEDLGRVELIDVRSPAAPAPAASYPIFRSRPAALAVAGPLVYVAGQDSGLHVLRAPALFQPAARLHLPQLGR